MINDSKYPKDFKIETINTIIDWLEDLKEPKQPKLEGWEKRFNKLFPDYSDLPSTIYRATGREIILRKNIKQFIKDELKRCC